MVPLDYLLSKHLIYLFHFSFPLSILFLLLISALSTTKLIQSHYSKADNQKRKNFVTKYFFSSLNTFSYELATKIGSFLNLSSQMISETKIRFRFYQKRFQKRKFSVSDRSESTFVSKTKICRLHQLRKFATYSFFRI